MIQIDVDEAFGYDLIAIASIKAERNPTNEGAHANLARLLACVEGQVGHHRHVEVLASPEYARLRQVNDEMYVRIDELKQRGEQLGDARYVDDRVYQRFLAKQALQQTWFGTTVTEQKHGYAAS